MCEVGEGNLNRQSILHACDAAGIEWYIIELDKPRLDPMEWLVISLRNRRGLMNEVYKRL
jgi:hypothetical protein